MSILKPQNSISWIGGINAVLSLQYNKKHELLLLLSKGSLKVKLNPNQAHVCCVSRHMAKLCSYILYKNFSKKCYKREAPLQEGRTKFDNGVLSGTWKVMSPTSESIFFDLVEKTYFCGENISTEEFMYHHHLYDQNFSHLHYSEHALLLIILLIITLTLQLIALDFYSYQVKKPCLQKNKISCRWSV